MAGRKTEQGTIEVSGTGRVAVQPDVADLRLGVSLVAPTVDEARRLAAETMTAVLAAVDRAGVERRDVRTTLLAVQPRYDYRDGSTPSLTGYELANVVEVVVRDLGTVTDVVDGTLRAGATSMDGLSFRLEDPAPAEREARLRAMAEARGRAEVLAEAAGLSIAKVLGIIERPTSGPPLPFARAERLAMAADAPTPVESGTLEVAVTVTVTYRVQ